MILSMDDIRAIARNVNNNTNTALGKLAKGNVSKDNLKASVVEFRAYTPPHKECEDDTGVLVLEAALELESILEQELYEEWA